MKNQFKENTGNKIKSLKKKIQPKNLKIAWLTKMMIISKVKKSRIKKRKKRINHHSTTMIMKLGVKKE